MTSNLPDIFTSCSWININSTRFNKTWQLIKYSSLVADIIMCHVYRQANPNWCFQLLPCFNSEKSGSLVTNMWSFTVAATKTCKAIEFTCLWDSWSFTCSSKTVHYHTELARCCVFGLQDARFHGSMLHSADTISIFQANQIKFIIEAA